MISIREATRSDLPSILKVEQSWPPAGQAGADKFLARLDIFPQGFFLACIQNNGNTETVAATITSMPLSYESAKIGNFENWDHVTNHGYLYKYDIKTCNALYIISGVIDCEFRGLNIFSPMVLRIVELAQNLGLKYVLAGAVIPGYKKYCEQHGAVSAYDYCTTRRGKHLVDPLLTMYESIGFTVPDAKHIISEYYPDDDSCNFAALVVRDLQKNHL